MFTVLAIIAKVIGLYIGGAYATFRAWTFICPPELWYSGSAGEVYKIKGWGESDLISASSDWHLKNAAAICLGLWWLIVPFAGAVVAVKSIAKLFIYSAIKPKKPKLPKLDKYQQLALNEVNAISPEDA